VTAPELRGEGRELLLVDLGGGKCRIGGSALAQVYGQLGDVPPDLEDPSRLVRFYAAMQMLAHEGHITAYHDRSDGGLVVTALEMAFASGVGLELETRMLEQRDPFRALFAEELGAIIEVVPEHIDSVRALFDEEGLSCAYIGHSTRGDRIHITHEGNPVIETTRSALRARWSHVTHAMARSRDDETCADEEHASRGDRMTAKLTFDPVTPAVLTARPRVAILREQGVNGQIEMAAAFARAGFEAVDVHMTDLVEGRIDLADCTGAVACGGFSFGDVLGAGRGWAATFRYNARAREAIDRLLARTDTFVLGVCNGCQMIADLAPDLLPALRPSWPRFVRNRSDRFEARLVSVRIEPSPSLFFRGMEGSWIPIANAHGEGRAEFAAGALDQLEAHKLVAARFVDARGEPTQLYPQNPNGSPNAIAAITSPDGRITAIMPHPERVFRTVQMSWHPPEWAERDDSPWMRMFHNARAWCA
jgi:phosphoribosylformylglycinamidine synthase